MNQKPLALPAPRAVTIRVGPIEPAQIRALCNAPGKREFNVHSTLGPCRVTQSKSYPYKGRFKTWAKWENEAWVTSYATVSAHMVTLHHALHGERVLRAPAGMEFQSDSNGVFLRRLSDRMDYHPTFDDWRSDKFATVVREAMSKNWKARQEQKRAEKRAARNKREQDRLEKLFQRDLPTTRVTLLDSRKAGNCVEGSLAFAERKLHVTREEVLGAGYLFSVPASRLLAVANGDTVKALNAARVAWARETAICI